MAHRHPMDNLNPDHEIRDSKSDFTLYHIGDDEGSSMIGEMVKLGLGPRTSIQDLRYLKRYPGKYPWMTQRNVRNTPSFYDNNLGVSHEGSDGMRFIAEKAREAASAASATSASYTPRTGAIGGAIVGGSGVTAVAGGTADVAEMFRTLNQKMEEMRITHISFETQVLSLLNKIANAQRAPNGGGAGGAGSTGGGGGKKVYGTTGGTIIDAETDKMVDRLVSTTRGSPQKEAKVIHSKGGMLAHLVSDKGGVFEVKNPDEALARRAAELGTMQSIINPMASDPIICRDDGKSFLASAENFHERPARDERKRDPLASPDQDRIQRRTESW